MDTAVIKQYLVIQTDSELMLHLPEYICPVKLQSVIENNSLSNFSLNGFLLGWHDIGNTLVIGLLTAGATKFLLEEKVELIIYSDTREFFLQPIIVKIKRVHSYNEIKDTTIYTNQSGKPSKLSILVKNLPEMPDYKF